jgi:uncharacterized protein with PIN domain
MCVCVALVDSVITLCRRSGGYTQLTAAQVRADGDDIPAKVLAVVTEFWRCNNAACRKLYWEGPKFHGTRGKFTALLARVAGGGGGGGGSGGDDDDEAAAAAAAAFASSDDGSDAGEGRGGAGGSGSDEEDDYGEYGRGAPARAAEDRAAALPRLITDERLKRLARWLRALGADVAIAESGTLASELVAIALDERRTVITVDSEVSGRG